MLHGRFNLIPHLSQDLPAAPPPVREVPRLLPGFSCDFQPPGTGCDEASPNLGRRQSPDPRSISDGISNSLRSREEAGDQKCLPGRDLFFPQYTIRNHAAGDNWSHPPNAATP